MKDYKELIARLRTTKSQSKRKMLDEAADVIEHLQRLVDHKEAIRQEQAKTIMELRKRLEAAEECIEAVADEFDRNHCHNDYAEAAIEEWRAQQWDG